MSPRLTSSAMIIYWEQTMSIELLTQLKELRLYGMAETWAEIKAEALQRKQDISPEQLLSQLVNAEITDRYVRSLRYQLKVAKFHIHLDLVDFKWAETTLSKQQIEQLAPAKFMDDAHNLILVGGTGTGKTHLATALGVAAVHHEKRVRLI